MVRTPGLRTRPSVSNYVTFERENTRVTFETPALGLRQATLNLVDYDPRWAELYKAEAALIFRALPGLDFDIAHIGSTAVQGLVAKPILDIAMRSNDEDIIAETLVGLGYIDRGMCSGRLFIRVRDGNIRTHNLHFYRPDDTDFEDQITFRDALRRTPALRDSYACLKHALVKELGDTGRSQYAERKTDFVKAAIDAHRA